MREGKEQTRCGYEEKKGVKLHVRERVSSVECGVVGRGPCEFVLRVPSRQFEVSGCYSGRSSRVWSGLLGSGRVWSRSGWDGLR